MDSKDLRHEAEVIHNWADNARVKKFCDDVLRILDAFEAMQEHNWMIHRNNTETATGDVVECWDVVASDGTCLAELGDPISSLLTAATTLEDKTDG